MYSRSVLTSLHFELWKTSEVIASLSANISSYESTTGYSLEPWKFICLAILSSNVQTSSEMKKNFKASSQHFNKFFIPTDASTARLAISILFWILGKCLPRYIMQCPFDLKCSIMFRKHPALFFGHNRHSKWLTLRLCMKDKYSIPSNALSRTRAKCSWSRFSNRNGIFFNLKREQKNLGIVRVRFWYSLIIAILLPFKAHENYIVFYFMLHVMVAPLWKICTLLKK